jgi:hypothetical protein
MSTTKVQVACPLNLIVNVHDYSTSSYNTYWKYIEHRAKELGSEIPQDEREKEKI